ncbi:hypothetical protein PYW07_015958 [Mythimna separata]|uniref:Uncharacterized protein n=1 Tax=Mythimna separata TaxID=271217 RepID=A0AAD7YRK9_MYTSE|nr:hypothetical protein PYW07_015958 [Mythimna separata]
MKLTISILFCVILTLQYNGADGKLKDLFGKIHDSVHGTADKVKEDLNSLFHPNDKNQQGNNDASSNIHFADSEENTDAAKKPDEVTPAPTTTTTAAPAVPNAPSDNPTTLAPSTTTKDGRENFSGGCVAGYMRTPDGRCKPTF